MEALARVESIPGWLRPEDADKLWELAQRASGPILEIGTYRGKSTVLMALALNDAGHENVIYTLDVDRGSLVVAAAEAAARDLVERIVFIHGTVGAFARAYPQVRPAVTFVDGDHSKPGVDHDLAVLERIVPAGGLILFHDFADPRNADPQCGDTQVRPAVEASWVARQCVFHGTFGVCGLYERAEAPELSDPTISELMPLDSVRDQYRYRLRYPAGRLLRRITQKR